MSIGVEHSIGELCNAWLMYILKISGGIHNIPPDKMRYICKLEEECTDYYLKLYGKQKCTNINDFWRSWKNNCPDFFEFEQYIKYNCDQQAAIIALKMALEYFEL